MAEILILWAWPSRHKEPDERVFKGAAGELLFHMKHCSSIGALFSSAQAAAEHEKIRFARVSPGTARRAIFVQTPRNDERAYEPA